MIDRREKVDRGRPALKQRFGRGSMILVGVLSIAAILAIFVGIIVVYGGLHGG